ncbi:hypothetical protein [Qipengyuania sp. JC766]|uniref:hypothetical protein n=1 Tax=Qipengyuania sp. JC766 TaxID=3232139 RepID=UPI00345AEDC6
MSTFKFLAGATLAMAVGLAAPAVTADDAKATKGQEKLARMLEGKVAGEPVGCINNTRGLDLTVIDETALVYKRGSTLYVNYTTDPEDIDDDDVLVLRTTIGSLCSTDVLTTRDRAGGFFTGNLFLEEFIPYRPAER